LSVSWSQAALSFLIKIGDNDPIASNHVQGNSVRKVLPYISLLLFCLYSTFSYADIAILIHGYQSSGHQWRSRGVVNQLHAQGWYDGGHFTQGPRGILGPTERGETHHVVYTLDLPNEAPILYQVEALNKYLQAIRKMAEDERIILIGYSTGGVVARATMVFHPEHRISQLITITSPHRGTEAAYFAYIMAKSPMGDMADWLGLDSLPRSRQLFSDLRPEDTGTFLYWLNRQPHPWASYVSIVRVENRFTGGDILIPHYSQDMRYIPAIGQRAHIVPTPGDHKLTARDGIVLSKILNFGF